MKSATLHLACRPDAQNGFTMVELLTVMVVAAIVIALAVPGMSTFIAKNQRDSIPNEFMSALALARSEAIKRDLSAAVTATSPVAGNEFGGGWTVWVDMNGDGVEQASEILRSQPALPPTLNFGNGATTSIAFNGRGYLSPMPATAPQIKLCTTGSSNATGYLVTVQLFGLGDVEGNQTCP